MKNWLKVFGAMMATTIPVIVNAQTTVYTLNGKVGDLSAPAKAYLMYSDSSGRKIDSTHISNGKFTFTGTLDQPKMALVFISKKGLGVGSADAKYITLYLETGNIFVISPDSIQKAKISAGPINADNAKLKLALADATGKMNALNKIFYAALPEQQKSKAFIAEFYKKSDSVWAEQKAIYLHFIKDNPSSIISLFALKNYAGPFPYANEVEPVLQLLSANIRESKAGLEYTAEIARLKKIALGAPAPDFTMADTLGKAVSLYDFKGKYVLIDFWASWCGPCRQENPDLIKAYNLLKDKNFIILGVSLDQNNGKKDWLNAIHDDHLPWTQVANLKGWQNVAAQLYEVKAIPQNFLVSPDGKIISKNIKGEDLTDKLKEILDKKTL